MPNTIVGESQKFNPTGIVEMYELDLTPFSQPIFRFHNGVSEVIVAGSYLPVVWQGLTYTALPVQGSGWSRATKGATPRPHLSIGNPLGTVSSFIQLYNDLVNLKVTRKRTLVKYLDAVNFPSAYMTTTTSSSARATTPHVVKQNIGTSRLQEWVARIAPSSWAGAGAAYFTILSKYDATGVLEWAFFLHASTGIPTLQLTESGVGVVTYLASAATGFSAAAYNWVKCVRNRDTGVIKFYTSVDQVIEPELVTTWTQLGTDVVCADRDITASAVLAVAGYAVNGAYTKMAGDIGYASFGKDGLGVKTIEFFSKMGGHGTTTLTARSGEVWTISAPATLAGGNPTANSAKYYQDEVFFVSQKVAENNDICEFELVSPWDVQGVQLPRRQILNNSCWWRYKGDGCGYAGVKSFDTNDVALADSSPNDVCGHRLGSCKLRHPNLPLPFGNYPGAGRVR